MMKSLLPGPLLLCLCAVSHGAPPEPAKADAPASIALPGITFTRSLNGAAARVARTGSVQEARAVNDALLELGRILIPASYARREIFEHDPAYEVAPFAEVAPAADLPRSDGRAEQKFLLNQLLRGRNKVLYRLRRARRAAQPFLAA